MFDGSNADLKPGKLVPAYPVLHLRVGDFAGEGRGNFRQKLPHLCPLTFDHQMDLPAGQILEAHDLEYRRPGFGIPVGQMERLVGKPLLNAKQAGERLEWADIGR